jgi:hypothetical protein
VIGDRDGRHAGELLAALHNECRVDTYRFHHITEHTGTMVRQFREDLKGEGIDPAWLSDETVRSDDDFKVL